MLDFVKLKLYQRLGYKSLRKGKHEKALKHFEKAMIISQEVSIIFNYVVALSALGKYSEAYPYLKKILSEYRDNEMAISLMLWVCMMLRKWEEAISLCEQIRLQFPSNQEFIHLYDILQNSELRERFISAHSLIKQADQKTLKKEYSEAVDLLKKALEINPDEALAYNNLASIHFTLKLKDEAKAYIKKAVELDPLNKRYKQNLRIIDK
ncbi:tetratricopeptide repeat protein [bacterium]|nr:tetratricopeptide repeat protein [bacterium]